MNSSKIISHITITPNENGGESLYLLTRLHKEDNGDQFCTQELKLQSYCRSSSFDISFDFTPERLRAMANELEEALVKNNYSDDEE